VAGRGGRSLAQPRSSPWRQTQRRPGPVTTIGRSQKCGLTEIGPEIGPRSTQTMTRAGRRLQRPARGGALREEARSALAPTARHRARRLTSPPWGASIRGLTLSSRIALTAMMAGGRAVLNTQVKNVLTGGHLTTFHPPSRLARPAECLPIGTGGQRAPTPSAGCIPGATAAGPAAATSQASRQHAQGSWSQRASPGLARCPSTGTSRPCRRR
jgi:hypothetical protein